MDPLTPNTSAFLSYLNESMHEPQSYFASPQNLQPLNKSVIQPTSLPPSAFFNMPVPGRDTPEDTPESSNAASVSPDKQQSVIASDGSDQEGGSGQRRKSSAADRDAKGNGAVHKRKAGHAHTVEEDSEDDDDSELDDPAGHEDKRPHPNNKAGASASGSGRRGGRKSTDEGGKGSKEMGKAARRKEQNRAAQKAFRERREAKVKDLEDQVAALEAKSFGVNVENENLRGILKRLQEENVSLKQAAFTFSMPANGSRSASGINTPNAQTLKPPTPPQSVDDSLRSINDVPSIKQRKSSGMSGISKPGMADSPESLNSINHSSRSTSQEVSPPPPAFDSAELFNAFAMGVRPEWGRQLETNKAITAAALGQKVAERTNSAGSAQNKISPAQAATNGQNNIQPNTNFSDAQSIASAFAAFSNPSSSSISPLSSASNDRAAIDALWASFYPQTNGQQANGNPTQQSISGNGLSQAIQNGASNPPPYNAGQTAGGFGSLNNPNIYNVFSSNNVSGIDKMAFRDQSAQPAPAAQPAQDAIDWSNLNDSNVDEFLASLSGDTQGANVDQAYDQGAEDDFNATLQKLLDQTTGGSPGSAFALPSTGGFSPTNYLNISPSPLASLSNSQSPSSHSGPSNSASPESIGSQPSTSATSISGYGGVPPAQVSQIQQTQQQAAQKQQATQLAAVVAATAKPGEVVHVVGDDGKVLKPSDLWVKMGMQHSNNVDNLVIDDLCDQMKAKATCQDGSYQLHVSDAEKMFRRQMGNQTGI